MSDVRVSLVLPRDLLDRVDAAARERVVGRALFVRLLLDAALDRLADSDDEISTVLGPASRYQPAPDRPAGLGWCEVVVPRRGDDPGGRYCYTRARYLNGYRHVCGIHHGREGLVYGRRHIDLDEPPGWEEIDTVTRGPIGTVRRSRWWRR